MAKEIKSNYKVIGVMAGSSMDGLDIAEVFFTLEESWVFQILRSKSYSYDDDVFEYLSEAAGMSRPEQEKIDHLFGDWIAKKLVAFGIDGADLISVHGHTVMHKPEQGVSWQLGAGRTICDLTDSTVVSDFRTLDVSLGGEGAPLVPIGDFQLFPDYQGCLNLGGIANVSIREKGIAWDICPCNQVLNFFANKLGKRFDENGDFARRGTIDSRWKEDVSSNSYYQLDPPKSLPNQFTNSEILDSIGPIDGLASYTDFICEKVIEDISGFLTPGSKILSTGGGAFNSFLIEKLNSNEKGVAFYVPDRELVEFKEAVVFGFLGILKVRNEVNVLASVTGSSRDTSSGIIHYPK